MHPFSLVIFLTLAAGSSSRPIPAGCREDHGTCREDCTIDYGGSTTKYRQLGDCLQRCDREQHECTSRHYSQSDSNQAEPSVPAEPAVKQEPVVAPVAQPKPAPEPAVEGSEPAPAPKPEPRPAAPPRPTPPPEPKKKDISEWDPNGD
jgi:hypothetical protein